MKPIEEWLNRPGGLTHRLRAMRRSAGLTGGAVAQEAGWPTSKISKIENGKQVPTREDLEAWSRICGGQPGATRELLDLLEQATIRHEQFRHQLRYGQAGLQRSYDEMARGAAAVFDFELLLIPGLLQTTDYARHRIEENVRLYGFRHDEVQPGVAARMRRQEVLYDASKTFEFIITEAALRVPLCPPEVMLGQLDRLLNVAALSHISLGLMPFDRQLRVAPVNNFLMLDDTVIVETFVSEIVLTGEESAQYQRIAELVRDDAVFGDQALRIIREAAADLR